MYPFKTLQLFGLLGRLEYIDVKYQCFLRKSKPALIFMMFDYRFPTNHDSDRNLGGKCLRLSLLDTSFHWPRGLNWSCANAPMMDRYRLYTLCTF